MKFMAEFDASQQGNSRNATLILESLCEVLIQARMTCLISGVHNVGVKVKFNSKMHTIDSNPQCRVRFALLLPSSQSTSGQVP